MLAMRKVRVCPAQGVKVPDYFKLAWDVQSKSDAKIDDQGMFIRFKSGSQPENQTEWVVILFFSLFHRAFFITIVSLTPTHALVLTHSLPAI